MDSKEITEEIVDFTPIEKVRLKMKWEHEGGLGGMLNYGIPQKLYDLFPALDICYKVSKEIEDYFDDIPDYSDSEFSDSELNEVELY